MRTLHVNPILQKVVPLFLFIALLPLTTLGQASLPTSYSGSTWTTSLPTGWTQSGVTNHTSSLDASGNAAKFTSVGDQLTIQVGSTPSSVSYYFSKTNGLGLTGTFVIEESVNGSSWSTLVTYSDLSPATNTSNSLAATTRYIRFRFSSTSLLANTFLIDGISISCGTPNTQSTSLAFNTVYNLGMSCSWTNGNGTGRSVFMAAANSGTPSPVDGTTYTANSVFGSGSQIGASGWYCVYSGTGTSVSITGLTANTTYRVMVLENNCTGTSIKYATTTSTNIANQTTTLLCVPPTTQASSSSVSNLGPTYATINYTRGNGLSGVIILLNQGSAVPTNPTNGTNYTANTTYGSGDLINGASVIFKGTSTNTTVSNLNTNTTYYYAIYEYTSNAYCYMTPALTGSFTTQTPSVTISSLPANPISFGNIITGNSSSSQTYSVQGSNLAADVSITAPTNFLVSKDNVSFSSSITLLKNGSNTLGASPQSVYIKYAPSSATGAISTTINHTTTGATAQQVNVTGNSISLEPTTNGSITFGVQTPTSLIINFTSGNGNNRIVVMRPQSAVSYSPTDATTQTGVNSDYSIATDKGSGNKIVYDGNGNTVSVTGLTANQTYYVTVYEYNIGTGTSQNYLTSSAATNNVYLIDDAVYITDNNGTPVLQNFNGLATTGTSATLGTGWKMFEYGSSANQLYTTSDGSNSTADCYSFGTGSSSDRALGSVNDGTENSYIGFKIINTSGSTVTSILINYFGEQWRIGNAGRIDKLDFVYSTDATALNNGTWFDLDELDFTAPNTTSSVGALDGNLSSNRTQITGSITNLTIANYGWIWIKFIDNDATGSDDGLAVDDITITPFTNTITSANSNISTSLSNVNLLADANLTADVTITGSLNIKQGVKLNLNGNQLTLQGNILSTPQFIGSATSSIIISGSGEVSEIYFDQTSPSSTNKIKNFTFNRTSTTLPLGNTLLIANNGELNVTSGTFNSKGNLWLESTLSGTARIGELSGGASVTGIVNIQRWMIGGAVSQRGWRTMSCPVNNDTARYAELLDDILITGPGGALNYFDGTRSTSSVLPYEESASRGWKTITTPYDVWPKGKGALVFFRGDRTQTNALTNVNTSPNSFAIDFSGPINQGTATVNLDYDNTNGVENDWGWNLVGNPYPSQIDWNTVTKTAFVDDYYYVINPNTKNYVSLNSGQIAIAQGFFVLTVQQGESITFNESNKSSGAGTAYFKTAHNALKVTLEKDSGIYDEAWLKYTHGASKNYVFKEDAKKLLNDLFNIAFVANNNQLLQQHICPTNPNSDTTLLAVSATTSGTYKLRFPSLSTNTTYTLIDAKLNLSYTITSSYVYQFQITLTDTTTFGNRFRIVASSSMSALPIQLLSFDAQKTSNGTELTWQATSNTSNQWFEIELSDDNTNFETIKKVKANPSGGTTIYNYVDFKRADKTTIYYRLKINQQQQVDDSYYSKTIAITEESGTENLITIYPNPTTDWLTIKTPNTEQILNVNIFDCNGQLMLSQESLNSIHTKNLFPGFYTISISTNQRNKNYVFVKK